MDIYVKPVKKVTLADRKMVLIKDIADVVATGDAAERILNIKVLDIPAVDTKGGKKQKKAQYLISVTDIIKAIQKAYPNDSVSNVGEMDTVIDYATEKSVDNPYFRWLKIAFVSIILFTGSSTAIMCFHSDAQMPEIFGNYYKLFFGVENEKPLIVDIPYSIGLAVGIVVFFNHFAGKKLTEDPTPIEVEMSQYENDVTITVADVLETRKEQDKKGGRRGGR